MKVTTDKLIFVIGGTGAQGQAVVKALLEPSSAGAPSPYAVRILTRNPDHPEVRTQFNHPNIELVQGSFTDLSKVEHALEGVWGAYINTDGFTVGEQAETYYGLRIFELAARVPTLKHYVWSSLDYGLKKAGYRPEYHCGHYDGKGRIADWLTTKPFSTQADAFKWTVFTNGPYAEMLYGGNFMPEILDDGTRVFAAPLGKGHIPIITLPDLGYFARYIFDHPVETAGKNLEVASDYLAWSDLAAAFTKVTGLPAIYQPVTYSQWIAAHPLKDAPVAVEDPRGMSFADNFRAWWKLFEDDVCTRDMEFCRRLHPKLQDIETWMRATGYDGRPKPLLKTFVDAAAAKNAAKRGGEDGELGQLPGPKITPGWKDEGHPPVSATGHGGQRFGGCGSGGGHHVTRFKPGDAVLTSFVLVTCIFLFLTAPLFLVTKRLFVLLRKLDPN